MSYQLTELNHTGIPPLLQGIATLEQWNVKLQGIREVWLEYIGQLPARVPTNVEILSETEELDHKRIHIRYDSAYDDKVSAYLLVPGKKGDPDKTSYPAVLALHPTNELGKDGIAMPGKTRKNREYGLELVSRGYVVLAPDALTSGERIYDGYPSFHSGPFYERHPEWSTVAKNICDHRQGLDVLCDLAYVDSGAIGAIGHSFGAYNAYFLAGVDERVKAIVSSCGISPFTGDLHPEHWGYRKYPYTHLPRVTPDLLDDRVPFEFHEIMALCAPTPFFVYAGQQDHIFPHWKSIGEAILEVAQLYRWLGREDDFVGLIGSAGHDFPPSIRLQAYQFLDHWLKVATSEDANVF